MKNEINPKQQLMMNIITIIVIIGLLVCTIVFGKLGNGLVAGFTAALYLPITQIRKYVKMMKDPELKKQEEIAINDERTNQINEKTGLITGGIILVACSVAGLVSIFLDRYDYLWIFGGVVIVYTLAFIIVRGVLNRKY